MINEVPVGDAGAKVDHVVIGPSGVFTIDTKNLTGKVWVGPKSILYNRRSTDFLPRATARRGVHRDSSRPRSDEPSRFEVLAEVLR